MAKLFLHILTIAFLSTAAGAQTFKALFDNTLNETAGNADWIIDVQQPVPVPAQSGITPSTTESYWLGAISAWGVALAQRGFTVHTLTSAYGITYGNAGNPYDLSNYDLFVVCEPQNPLTASEKQAIHAFVQHGGGLMMVADHNGSDRDNDGWDSPEVWNDAGIDTSFGLHFQSASESDNSFTQVATNVSTSSGDSIIHGPAGTANALSYHAGTSIRLLTGNNSTAAGHIWMNGAPHGVSQIVAATARYGNGRVGAVGDSSPADDGTGQSGNSLYDGWGEVGATDDILFINMSLWLVSGGAVAPPDQAVLNTPLQGAAGLAVPVTCSWYATATADRYQVQLSLVNTFASTVINDTNITETFRLAGGLAANTVYYWRVRAHNAGGWGAYSSSRDFSTWTTPPQTLLQNPGDGETGTAVPTVFSWQPASSATRYHFALDTSAAFAAPLVSDSSLVGIAKLVGGLEQGRPYFWHVRAGNGAGWGAFSLTRGFTTWLAPGQVALLAPADSTQGLSLPVACIWEPQPGATAYHFQLSSDAAFAAVLLSDTSLTDTVRAVPAADTLTTLFWRVRARNGAGWGPFSEPRRFRIGTVLNVPVTTVAGWQVVSVPVTVPDPRATSVFPSAASALYGYNAGYTERDSLVPGAGYWVRFTIPGVLVVSGDPLTLDTVEVHSGWNLIGSISATIGAASVQSVPSGIVVFPFYAFQGSYTAADSLVPGTGYWVRCTGDGQIILRSAARR